MNRSSARSLLRGVAAGMAGAAVQSVAGKAAGVLLLPDDRDSYLAPRLIDRLGKMVGIAPTELEEWTLGTAFHFGYGGFWGAAYAAARERTRVGPLLGGALLGGLIYGITFPRWGGAVQTGTVRAPQHRSDGMDAFGVAAALSFGIGTAFAYEVMRRRGGAGGD